MTARMELAAKLDTEASEALAETLIAQRGTDLVLDASNVEHFGAYGIQILVMAAHSWNQDGHSLTLEGVSEGQMDQLSSIGLPPSYFMTVENAV